MSTPPTQKTPHLLLVEDNPLTLRILNALINQLDDIVCFAACSAEEAIALTKKHHFDLIITDLGLPEVSGYDFVKKFRYTEKQDKHLPTPIIGLTAHPISDVKPQCLDAGMSEVLPKPMNLSTLKRIIDMYINRKTTDE